MFILAFTGDSIDEFHSSSVDILFGAREFLCLASRECLTSSYPRDSLKTPLIGFLMHL